MWACVHVSEIITLCFSQSEQTTAEYTSTKASSHRVCVRLQQIYIHIKKKSAAGVVSMMPQPQSHTTSAVTHMSNTSGYSEIPQKKRKTRSYWSPLKQMESHSIRGPLCLSSCLCVSAPDSGRKTTRCKEKKKRSAFPLRPKKRDYQSHNNTDASQ